MGLPDVRLAVGTGCYDAGRVLFSPWLFSPFQSLPFSPWKKCRSNGYEAWFRDSRDSSL